MSKKTIKATMPLLPAQEEFKHMNPAKQAKIIAPYIPLLETVERLKAADSEIDHALKNVMAERLRARSSVLPERLLKQTRKRVDDAVHAAAMDNVGQDGRVAYITAVLDAAVLDFEELPSVKRSQRAIQNRPEIEKKRRAKDDLILAELLAASTLAQKRFPHRRRTKGELRDLILCSLKSKGQEDISRKQIEKVLAKR